MKENIRIQNEIIKPVAVAEFSCLRHRIKFGKDNRNTKVGLDSVYRLQCTQRALERRMLGSSLNDRERNEEIKRRTKVSGIVERAVYLKLQTRPEYLST